MSTPIIPPERDTATTARAGRFAPSPSADLHLGNLRTAVLAWLFARSSGRRFLVRVDDLDPDRSSRAVANRQLADLQTIGVEWDDTPAWQSERRELYVSALDQLAQAGLTYRCFCTRADIRTAATAPHDHLPEGAYPGTCSHMSEHDSTRRAEAGEPWSLRVRASGTEISFEDVVMGRVTASVDDFVVQRKDGVAAYNVATVVDDAEQGIDQVIRGADLAVGTPRQIWLAHALNLDAPEYGHVPLVLGADGTRLAKRHGAVTLHQLRDAGIGAGDVLALLARSLDLAGPGEKVTLADLVARFDPAKVPPDATVLELPGTTADDS